MPDPTTPRMEEEEFESLWCGENEAEGDKRLYAEARRAREAEERLTREYEIAAAGWAETQRLRLHGENEASAERARADKLAEEVAALAVELRQSRAHGTEMFGKACKLAEENERLRGGLEIANACLDGNHKAANYWKGHYAAAEAREKRLLGLLREARGLLEIRQEGYPCDVIDHIDAALAPAEGAEKEGK